jgi:integrase
MYGSTQAREFGPLALKAVRQQMVDSGLARQVVSRRVKRIVRVFSYGVENELVPAETLQALREVKSLLKGRSRARETAPVGTVPDADVDAARPFLSRQLQAVVELRRLTGMRSGEALAIRGADLDTSAPVWLYTPVRHKTEHHGKARCIPLGPRAQEVLRPWLRPDPAEYLFQPKEAMAERAAERRKARRTPMTSSQRARRPKSRPKRAPGDRYSPRGYARAVRSACAEAGGHPLAPPPAPAQRRDKAAAGVRP